MLLPVLLLLAQPVPAADCGMVIASDGGGCRECAMGDLGADALRYYTGADVALLPAAELGISLQAGPIDEQALAESFPTDGTIVVKTMSREELCALLEQGVGHITLGEDERIDEEQSASKDFFCPAGLTFCYDASAPVGERLYELETESDAEYLTVAVPAEYADGTPVGTVREAVAAWASYCGTLNPPDTGRIQSSPKLCVN